MEGDRLHAISFYFVSRSFYPENIADWRGGV